MMDTMNMCVVLWCLLLMDLCHSKDHAHYMELGSRQGLTDEQNLLAKLMHNYDKHTRPVYNASHPVNVKLGITLNQIFDVDERNQVLTSHIWLDQEWDDEKMGWDPDDYNQLKTLRIPSELLWKPDIVLYNSADDYTNGYMPALAMVKHDGHVFWPPIVKLRSTCKIDITYFPFDDQTCSLKLGSWAYDGLQVDVLKSDSSIDLDNYVSNGEWELINVTVVRNVEYYGCCPEPYPDVTFTFHIRRRTLYYTYSVLIPCIMLSCLTLLEFWMPPEGGEKVALGLTVLLAFSVFMLLIAENMPATSFYVPLIGVYIIVAMGLTCVSVMFAVIVTYIYHQGSMNREVPNWLRSSAYYLNKIVRARSTIRQPEEMSLNRNNHYSHKNNNNSNGDSRQISETTFRTPLRSSFNSLNFSYRTETTNLDFENVHFKHELSPKKNSSRETLFGSDSGSSTGSKKKKSALHAQPILNGQRCSSSEELLHKLDLLLSKHEELLNLQYSQRLQGVNKEWQEISEVWDRFLFWVYFLMTTGITVIILILVPLGKNVTI